MAIIPRSKRTTNRQELKDSSSERWPVDATGQPIPPKAQPGYYPGFSTLGQQNYWDEVTRKVVLDRVNNVPPVRFFNPEELSLITAIIDRIMPQDDRDAAHKIPVVNYLDARLFNHVIDGYRYEDMPPDEEAYKLGMRAIEQIAQHMHGKSFTELEPLQQDEVLKTIHDNKPPAAHEIWKKMSILRFWQLLVQDAVDAYYSHPYAWDEIGFGGPAYPRGYMRQGSGEPEPWEVHEKRYEWKAPPTSLSGQATPIGGQGKDQSHVGQEGTH
ncbi:MAG TPA: gluconate 2-dehydrogenase subunit 3 family protein [Chloroflexia bacterium]|nr:gluconate 2-dehydrogenase subunit 3 family protein [Chloroflexia bacterium]